MEMKIRSLEQADSNRPIFYSVEFPLDPFNEIEKSFEIPDIHFVSRWRLLRYTIGSAR